MKGQIDFPLTDEQVEKEYKQPSANISFCPICDCMTKDILNSGEIWCGKCKLVKTKRLTPMIDFH